MAVQAPLPPPADLRDDVACVWSARLESEGLLIPDACIDVMWFESGRTVVCGPERHALTYRSQHPERVAGVRFRPGLAPRILRVSAAEIADQRIPLEDIVGSATARRAADRAGSSPSPGAALLCELRSLVVAAPAPDHIDAALDHELLSDAPPSVDHMATLTGVSARHVHRRAIRSSPDAHEAGPVSTAVAQCRAL